MMPASYLSTDEQMDVLISVRETLHQVQRSMSDPHCWKWAIIVLVSATNGALVCNLTGTMQIGALRKSDRAVMINAIQDTICRHGLSDLPEVYLETPMKLLRMVVNHDRSDPGSGPLLGISQDQQNAFEWLLSLRNNFMHFQPQNLSIATSDLPSIFLDVIGIVKAATVDGYSFRHLCEKDFKELTTTCALLEQALNGVEQRRTSSSEEVC